MSLAVSLPPTLVRSMPLADPGPLLARLPAEQALAWVRGGEGMVGWGELARLEVTGPDALAEASQWWAEQCTGLVVDDPVGQPGSGPICFGSAAFDRRTASSVFIVPRVVLGRRAGHSWLTAYGGAPTLPEPVSPAGPDLVAYAEGALTVTEWTDAVAIAISRIQAGQLAKVVLARDLLAHTTPAVDPRFLLQALAQRYPQCWTFAVDGLLGATPELLVRREGAAVFSRVLAGTVRRGRAEEDDALVASLLSSAKDLDEHRYAVQSVADALAGYCRDLDAPATPSVLRLANVAHLATDVSGQLRENTSVLDLVDALHPTAAVCGTPTDVALDTIRELEQMDRGRYAGPVGWMDSAGDGEWAIALRCAEVHGNEVRLLAGCGIMAGSEPAAELAESQAKLITVRDALSSA